MVCGAGQWRKDGGVVICWKQSLPSAGCGGTSPVILYSFLIGGRGEHWEGEHLERGSIGRGGALHREQSVVILFLHLVLLPWHFYHFHSLCFPFI